MAPHLRLHSTTTLHSIVRRMPLDLLYIADLVIATLTPQVLPITPEITPAFAVGGVLLILSGAAYTFIGIRNKWLYVFLSAGYLASLSVTVLILYVMNPPISSAVQGAYLVAIVMTGVILGGVALVFKEMTEGLACLFGGFSLSMWLLVLKPGGLVTTTGEISGFIAAFTLALYATSFSHVTRPYGLIVGISFGGATAVVLGIDCFSRAGLKEFWAYLWQLNDNLFPLGATTYPLTRGLRVEIAAIIIIFLGGVVSQMKLWRIIEKRREERKALRLQDERIFEQEEANVGDRIEQQNAQERNQWETVYGDKDAIGSSENPHRDSGVGDMDSKNGAMSTVTSIRPSAEDAIELGDMSPTLTVGAGLVMTNKGQDGGPVTIRVAREAEVPQALGEDKKPVDPSPSCSSHVSVCSSAPNKVEDEGGWVAGADGEARVEGRLSRRNSKQVAGAPVVVPLPFKVPEEGDQDDCSSVATFADDEEQKRKWKRFSGGSTLLKRLSRASARNSEGFFRGEGISTEDLVIPHGVEDDRARSVAATLDGMSDDEQSVRSTMEDVRDADVDVQKETPTANVEDAKLKVPESAETATKSPISDAIVGTSILEPATEAKVPEVEAAQKSLTSSTDPKITLSAVNPSKDAPEHNEKLVDAEPSVVSVEESKAATITQDRLPAQLSKVVMSYRTNEWAKHLSTAEAPELEELQIAENHSEKENAVTEVAVPVNVEELQQTPEDAPQPPTRTMSQTSNPTISQETRSSSALSMRPGTSFGQDSEGNLSRSLSQQSLHLQPSSQNLHIPTRVFARNSSTPNIPQLIVESPNEGSFDSSESPNVTAANRFSSSSNNPFGSSHTLMGERDTMLRSKPSYTNPSTLAPTPEISQQSSAAGSIYNHAPLEDDNMSLSQRRELIRQSSLQSLTAAQQASIIYDSHQPRRLSSAPAPIAREQQLASWRQSVQHEFQSTVQPRVTIERQRNSLWQERQAEEQKKEMEKRRRAERNSAFDARMRRGDMLDAHKEAMRKMQASANKHA